MNSLFKQKTLFWNNFNWWIIYLSAKNYNLFKRKILFLVCLSAKTLFWMNFNVERTLSFISMRVMECHHLSGYKVVSFYYLRIHIRFWFDKIQQITMVKCLNEFNLSTKTQAYVCTIFRWVKQKISNKTIDLTTKENMKLALITL